MSKGRSPKVRKSESPEDGKKSEVGSPKSEVKPKAESRKRKAIEKSEVGSPKSEEEENNSAPDSYRDDIPQSEIESRQTANSKLSQRDSLEQTEKMEIHHHPEVEKKGIKEYLLEGLMIFLAVMMGFFAESYREHLTEHSKEREYIINIKKGPDGRYY